MADLTHASAGELLAAAGTAGVPTLTRAPGRIPRAWGTAMARLGAVVLAKLPAGNLDHALDRVADLAVAEWRERGAPMSDAAIGELATDVASLTCAVVLAWRELEPLADLEPAPPEQAPAS